eukprot:1151964-Pelagomonas_calceolata.AAC.9
MQIVAVDELGLGIKKPGGPMLTPRRPGMGGVMSPAPLSRALVASTPQVANIRTNSDRARNPAQAGQATLWHTSNCTTIDISAQ